MSSETDRRAPYDLSANARATKTVRYLCRASARLSYTENESRSRRTPAKIPHELSTRHNAALVSAHVMILIEISPTFRYLYDDPIKIFPPSRSCPRDRQLTG